MRFRYIVSLLFLFSGIFMAGSCKPAKKELLPIRYNGSYNRDFNDLNDAHLSAALDIGVQPLADRDEAEHVKKKLKEIKSNKHIELEELTHSVPFLVIPENIFKTV